MYFWLQKARQGFKFLAKCLRTDFLLCKNPVFLIWLPLNTFCSPDLYPIPLPVLCLMLTESWSGSGSPRHHIRAWKGYRLLQALHDAGYKYTVPQAKRNQPWRLLLPQPSLARYLDVYSAGLLGCQLCAVCHSQVTCLSQQSRLHTSLKMHAAAIFQPSPSD